jgi:cytochrome d ubiquinol oxidase subunit II
MRAGKAAGIVALVLLAAFSLAGIWVTFVDGYVIRAIGDVGASINPLMKEVERAPGAWFSNYGKYPLLWLVPALAYVGGAIVLLALRAGRTLLAFVGSSLSCVSVIATAGIALFPFVLPSSEMPKASLTAWDATSSHFTLNVMLYVALIFTPIVVAYTGWAYHVMAGKITRDFIVENDKALY